MTIKRHNPGTRMSAAVVNDNTVYLAGQVSADLLGAVGSHKSKALSATVYLASMATYDEMNAAWDAWVDPSNAPARATVEAKLAQPKYLVEISLVAAV